MAIKRKLSFTQHMKFTLGQYHHSIAPYAAEIKLTKAEKTLLADYVNGHVSLLSLTAPMLTKMLARAQTKSQFKNAYALELIAINLSEQGYDTLCKMYKEDTLRKWLMEFSIMSRPMQEIYLDYFGYTVFEGSNLTTVQGGIDLSNRVTQGKPRTAKEAAEDARNLGLLRKSVSKGKTVAVEPEEIPPTKPDATNFRDQQHRRKEVNVESAEHSAADYFSAHVMSRIGERLQKLFNNMMDYHHDDKIPYLFKEFAKSPLSQVMADYWWETFAFEYVEYKGDDTTLKVSCRHFIVYINHKELTFVDKWGCGDIAYTIPTSDQQDLRLEQIEYFFQTWDTSRIKSVFQHIGFEQEDELVAAGQNMDLKTVTGGPRALLEMSRNNKPISWDGGEYTVYETLQHMKDGIRGAVWMDSTEAESSLRVGGIEYASVFVSDGPIKRYAMCNIDAQAFFREYTDHMGFDDSAHELRKHGFVLLLDNERAVMSFNDDKERPCEIIAYV